VLGCPNLPREPIADADAGAEAAGHAADSDVGVIFAARRGGGAHVGPLKSGEAAVHSGRHMCWQQRAAHADCTDSRLWSLCRQVPAAKSPLDGSLAWQSRHICLTPLALARRPIRF